jgi:hypothetical protein
MVSETQVESHNLAGRSVEVIALIDLVSDGAAKGLFTSKSNSIVEIESQ